jgi:5-deoxy-glucuronate isomerase
VSFLVKARKNSPEIVKVTRASAGWNYVGFAAYRLLPNEKHSVAVEPSDEVCIVVLSGRVSIRARDKIWRDIGERASVFEERSPYAVYLPRAGAATVTAHTPAEIAVASAPGSGDVPERLIEPSTMKRFGRGEGLNQRFICDILPQTQPADHLLVVEVVTPSGHSSSYPPHKHDTDNLPVESSLEETYYHRLDPPQGFAFQRVYTDDRTIDEALAVEDHDVVLVPRGYHPVVVPYGYTSYYLNVMAGPKREWHFKNDPAHEWMLRSR